MVNHHVIIVIFKIDVVLEIRERPVQIPVIKKFYER